jgi:hypothetical protein
MPDNVLMWRTGLFVLDAVQAGKLLSLKGGRLARFVKAVEPAGHRLSTQKRASAFPGTETSLRTGSRQLTKTAKNTYLAFGLVETQIA